MQTWQTVKENLHRTDLSGTSRLVEADLKKSRTCKNKYENVQSCITGKSNCNPNLFWQKAEKLENQMGGQFEEKNWNNKKVMKC